MNLLTSNRSLAMFPGFLTALATALCLLSINISLAQTAYVANNTDNTVSVVDLSTGGVTTTIALQGAPVKIAASPDGSQVVTVNLTSISVINTADNTLAGEITEGSELREVLYAPDGNTFFTVDQLTTLITPYDAATLTPGAFGFLTSGVGPIAAAFDPGTGNLVTVNNGSANLSAFTVSPLAQIPGNIGVGQAPQDIAFLPGTSTAYVSNFNNNNLSIVDVAGGSETGTVGELITPTTVVASPDGSTIYVINDGENNVSAVDVASGTVTATIPVGAVPRDLAFTPDGSLLIVANAGDNSLSVIDVATNTVTNTIEGVGNGPVGVVVVEGEVVNQPPSASFTATPTSGVAPLEVNFDASASSDPDGSIAGYEWDFGNGAAGSGVTTTATYTAAGEFTVTLTVTDDAGATATATQTITVEEMMGGNLQEQLQAVLDQQTVTEVSGLNFGGVSATVITPEGELLPVVTGQATPAIPMDETLRLGASEFTQTLLAVLALALEAEGALSLDQQVGDLFDVSGLTNVPGTVTINQLLSHTSGLDEFSDDPDYVSTILFDVNRAFTPEELTELFVDEPAAPGNFSYANTNFLVLGLALEAANGDETLQESLERLVLSPAGVTGIEFYQGSDPSDLAPLFADVFGTGFPQQLTPNTSIFTGASFAGNLLGTPTAFVQFLQALAESEILSAEDLERLLDFSDITGRLSEQYGLGIERFTLDIDGAPVPFIGHIGSINYVAVALYSPDANVGIHLVTNNGVATEEEVLELARQLLDVAIDDLVINQPPTASFTADPLSGTAPLEVNFDASASSDPDGSIASYGWDFGDGNTATGVTASNIFQNPGEFTVTLTVTDDQGATATATQVVTVEETGNELPTAAFTADPATGQAPLTVNFDGSNSSDPDGTIEAYAWDFGDGNTATGVTASNTFQNPGAFTVTLTVTDNNGGSNSVQQEIIVTPQPGEGVVATVSGPEEVPQGCDFPVLLNLNTTETVGSFTATLTWDPSQVVFFSDPAILNDYQGVVNDSRVEEGILIFNGARVEGQTGIFDIFSARFQAVGDIGSAATIEVAFSALASALDFRDLLPALEINNYTFEIVRQGLLGDVNGDDVVNSTDALIILTFEVGIDVGPVASELIAGGFGDVNDDGVTNSTDALIILTFDAGLNVDFPVGQETCPDEAAPLSGILAEVSERTEALQADPIEASVIFEAVKGDIADNDIVEVPVKVDMTGSDRRLGSFGAKLTWNTEVYELVGYAGGKTKGFESPVINDQEIEEGRIAIAHAYVEGGEGVVNIFNLRLRKKAGAASASDLDIEFTSMAAAKTFEALSPVVNPAVGSGNLNSDFAFKVFPNPFRSTLTLDFTLNTADQTEIAVFNSIGQQVRVLSQGVQMAGNQTITWDGKDAAGTDLAPGIYFIRLKAGAMESIQRVVLVK